MSFTQFSRASRFVHAIALRDSILFYCSVAFHHVMTPRCLQLLVACLLLRDKKWQHETENLAQAWAFDRSEDDVGSVSAKLGGLEEALHMCVEIRGQPQVSLHRSPPPHLFVFKTESLTEPCSLLIRLGWLVSKPCALPVCAYPSQGL